MIQVRDTGWWIKLYDEVDLNMNYTGMSDEFHCMLTSAVLTGYRMIEFDCDGTIYEQ